MAPDDIVETHDGQFHGRLIRPALTHRDQPQNWQVKWSDGVLDVVSEADIRVARAD